MPDSITPEDAQYALDFVKSICSRVGPGLPGTPQERQRAEMIKMELEKHLGAANVAVEEFTFAPDPFLGSYPGVICMLLAIVLNISTRYLVGALAWISSMVALVLTVLTAVLFIIEFIQGREVFDPLYPHRQSINVIGTLRNSASDNVRHLLILSGHHDSAFQLTWLRYLGYGFFVFFAIYIFGFITLLVKELIQLVGLIMGDDAIVQAGTLGWVVLIIPILPAIIFAMFLTSGRKNGGIVPGAADNLSASALAVSMSRFLVNHPDCVPADTEIRFISFGAEEACIRGSRRYVKRHLDELRHLDVRVLNYEIIVHPVISIITSDVGGVKNSPEMIESAIAAAQRADIPYKVVSSPNVGGGTDAGAFSEVGLKAVTLMPFKSPQQMVAFYHQDRDTPDVLTLEPLLNVLKLSLEWVRSGGN